jgi:hypothetical protein
MRKVLCLLSSYLKIKPLTRFSVGARGAPRPNNPAEKENLAK